MKKIYQLTMLSACFAALSVGAQTYNAVATYSGSSTSGLVDGPIATARFNHPYGSCEDPLTGTIYVADAGNNCIRRIRNGIVSTLAGNGVQGDVDAQGSNARFYGASGLCFYNGYLYITDNGNNKIKRIDTLGNVTTIAGTGVGGFLDGTALSAKFLNPSDIAVASNGDMYITDYGNNRIRKLSGGVVSNYAGMGTAGDQDGAATSAQLNRPRSLCVDASGNVYFCDMVNHKIKVVTTGGIVNLIAGSGTAGNTDGNGSSASFYSPTGIDFDLYGNLIVVDGGDHNVRRVTISGTVTTIAGTGTTGFVDGPALSAKFNDPEGMFVASDGTIYVGDRNNNSIRSLTTADVAVEEHDATINLNVFPNPATTTLIVKKSSAGTDALKLIQVFSVNGELVTTVSVERNEMETQVDISELAAGAYFLRAISEDGAVYTDRFIKQ